MSELIFTNARIVTADTEIADGTLVTSGGRILAVEEGRSRDRQAVDLGGDLLLPGFVELHTDNMERHFSPRPGVRWPPEAAVLAHDAEMAGAGVTTVFDAVRIGDMFDGDQFSESYHRMLGAIATVQQAGATRAEHLIHLRCEICFRDTATLFADVAVSPRVKLVSIMDHTPGQRQFVDAAKLKLYYTKKYGMTDAAFEAFCVERRQAHERYSPKNRRAIVEVAHARNLALASHDDATPEHVAESVADGMSIAEFPTTIEAASASHQAGLAVLVGGPNMVLGGSHSGNIAALELARRGVADILSSDYVPTSLLHGAFALARAEAGIGLPQAVRMVSLNAARAVGLDDRGELAPGKRADFVRLSLIGDIPVVREVWREGRRVV
jgi:alpha-D-ribose 1-methylphosphonate 5-triphosphate diphosphatase